MERKMVKKPERKTEKKPERNPEQNPEKTHWVETLQLEGRKAVLEALKHEQPIDRILVRKEADGSFAGTLKIIAAQAREKRILVQGVDRVKLDHLAQSSNHQGIIAQCPAKEYVSVAELLTTARERNEEPFIIVLDGITDPHNLGAIIRTAEAGGAHGVIIPKHRAVGLTGAVSKASAGAIAHMPIAKVTNIGKTLEDLKKSGLWVTCADVGPGSYAKTTDLFATDLTGPMAVVVGAEGDGVGRLVLEKADYRVRIPMLGRIEALNASVAAAILIYEVVRNRRRPS